MEEKDKAEETAEQEAAEEEAAEEEPVPEEKEPEEPVKAKPSDELKIVIILNAGKVMLGVQKTDCDPVYTTFEGTLPTALQRVPKLVKEAKEKWAANPQYPKADLPTPEPSRTPARTAAAPKKESKQPTFF